MVENLRSISIRICYNHNFRLYEGFLSHISLSFALSTSVIMNWKVPTVALACSYLYLFIRVSYRFDDVPHTLKIGISISILSFAFNAYLVSNNLKKEFLSIFKAEESSHDFKKFLHNLPEWISIIDDSTQTFKFFNIRLKETLDMKLYLKLNEHNEIIDKINQKVNSEYEKMKDSLGNEIIGTEDWLNHINNLMEKFSVKLTNEDNEIKKNFRIAGSDEEVKEIPLLEFLQKERKECQKDKNCERETQISLFLSDSVNLTRLNYTRKSFWWRRKKWQLTIQGIRSQSSFRCLLTPPRSAN